MKVCCVFSLELPHRCDSNEYIQHTIFNMKKKIIPNYPKSAVIFSYGLKNKFETAMVNKPSVFEPLKFYCIFKQAGHEALNRSPEYTGQKTKNI